MSAQAVLNWVRNFAIVNYEKPVPKDAIIVELDEMWHYLGSKNQLWIWKAYCRETGELIDWECGGRDKKTFLTLWNRLKKWNVELFCADEYSVYTETVPDRSQCLYHPAHGLSHSKRAPAHYRHHDRKYKFVHCGRLAKQGRLNHAAISDYQRRLH